MRTTQELAARKHLHRSEVTFIAAAIAVVFGVLSTFTAYTLLSNFQRAGSGGIAPSLLVAWAFYLAGFAISLWVVSLSHRFSRPRIR